MEPRNCENIKTTSAAAETSVIATSVKDTNSESFNKQTDCGNRKIDRSVDSVISNDLQIENLNLSNSCLNSSNKCLTTNLVISNVHSVREIKKNDQGTSRSRTSTKASLKQFSDLIKCVPCDPLNITDENFSQIPITKNDQPVVLLDTLDLNLLTNSFLATKTMGNNKCKTIHDHNKKCNLGVAQKPIHKKLDSSVTISHRLKGKHFYSDKFKKKNTQRLKLNNAHTQIINKLSICSLPKCRKIKRKNSKILCSSTSSIFKNKKTLNKATNVKVSQTHRLNNHKISNDMVSCSLSLSNSASVLVCNRSGSNVFNSSIATYQINNCRVVDIWKPNTILNYVLGIINNKSHSQCTFESIPTFCISQVLADYGDSSQIKPTITAGESKVKYTTCGSSVQCTVDPIMAVSGNSSLKTVLDKTVAKNPIGSNQVGDFSAYANPHILTNETPLSEIHQDCIAKNATNSFIPGSENKNKKFSTISQISIRNMQSATQQCLTKSNLNPHTNDKNKTKMLQSHISATNKNESKILNHRKQCTSSDNQCQEITVKIMPIVNESSPNLAEFHLNCISSENNLKDNNTSTSCDGKNNSTILVAVGRNLPCDPVPDFSQLKTTSSIQSKHDALCKIESSTFSLNNLDDSAIAPNPKQKSAGTVIQDNNIASVISKTTQVDISCVSIVDLKAILSNVSTNSCCVIDDDPACLKKFIEDKCIIDSNEQSTNCIASSSVHDKCIDEMLIQSSAVENSVEKLIENKQVEKPAFEKICDQDEIIKHNVPIAYQKNKFYDIAKKYVTKLINSQNMPKVNKFVTEKSSVTMGELNLHEKKDQHLKAFEACEKNNNPEARYWWARGNIEITPNLVKCDTYEMQSSTNLQRDGIVKDTISECIANSLCTKKTECIFNFGMSVNPVHLSSIDLKSKNGTVLENSKLLDSTNHEYVETNNTDSDIGKDNASKTIKNVHRVSKEIKSQGKGVLQKVKEIVNPKLKGKSLKQLKIGHNENLKYRSHSENMKISLEYQTFKRHSDDVLKTSFKKNIEEKSHISDKTTLEDELKIKSTNILENKHRTGLLHQGCQKKSHKIDKKKPTTISHKHKFFLETNAEMCSSKPRIQSKMSSENRFDKNVTNLESMTKNKLKDSYKVKQQQNDASLSDNFFITSNFSGKSENNPSANCEINSNTFDNGSSNKSENDYFAKFKNDLLNKPVTESSNKSENESSKSATDSANKSDNDFSNISNNANKSDCLSFQTDQTNKSDNDNSNKSGDSSNMSKINLSGKTNDVSHIPDNDFGSTNKYDSTSKLQNVVASKHENYSADQTGNVNKIFGSSLYMNDVNDIKIILNSKISESNNDTDNKLSVIQRLGNEVNKSFSYTVDSFNTQASTNSSGKNNETRGSELDSSDGYWKIEVPVNKLHAPCETHSKHLCVECASSESSLLKSSTNQNVSLPNVILDHIKCNVKKLSSECKFNKCNEVTALRSKIISPGLPYHKMSTFEKSRFTTSDSLFDGSTAKSKSGTSHEMGAVLFGECISIIPKEPMSLASMESKSVTIESRSVTSEESMSASFKRSKNVTTKECKSNTCKVTKFGISEELNCRAFTGSKSDISELFMIDTPKCSKTDTFRSSSSDVSRLCKSKGSERFKSDASRVLKCKPSGSSVTNTSGFAKSKTSQSSTSITPNGSNPKSATLVEPKSGTILEQKSGTVLERKSGTCEEQKSGSHRKSKSGTRESKSGTQESKSGTQESKSQFGTKESKPGSLAEAISITNSKTKYGTLGESKSGTCGESKSGSCVELKSGTLGESNSITLGKPKSRTHVKKSETCGESKFITHTESKSGTHRGTKSGTHGGIKSRTHIASKSGTNGESKSETHRGSKSRTHLESKSGTHLGSKSGTRLGSKSGTHQGSKSGTHQGSKSGTHGGSKSGTHRGSKPGAQGGSKSEIHRSKHGISVASKSLISDGSAFGNLQGKEVISSVSKIPDEPKLFTAKKSYSGTHEVLKHHSRPLQSINSKISKKKSSESPKFCCSVQSKSGNSMGLKSGTFDEYNRSTVKGSKLCSSGASKYNTSEESITGTSDGPKLGTAVWSDNLGHKSGTSKIHQHDPSEGSKCSNSEGYESCTLVGNKSVTSGQSEFCTSEKLKSGNLKSSAKESNSGTLVDCKRKSKTCSYEQSKSGTLEGFRFGPSDKSMPSTSDGSKLDLTKGSQPGYLLSKFLLSSGEGDISHVGNQNSNVKCSQQAKPIFSGLQDSSSVKMASLELLDELTFSVLPTQTISDKFIKDNINQYPSKPLVEFNNTTDFSSKFYNLIQTVSSLGEVNEKVLISGNQCKQSLCSYLVDEDEEYKPVGVVDQAITVAANVSEYVPSLISTEHSKSTAYQVGGGRGKVIGAYEKEQTIHSKISSILNDSTLKTLQGGNDVHGSLVKQSVNIDEEYDPIANTEILLPYVPTCINETVTKPLEDEYDPRQSLALNFQKKVNVSTKIIADPKNITAKAKFRRFSSEPSLESGRKMKALGPHKTFSYKIQPPSYDEIQNSIEDYGLEAIHNPILFCSNFKDIPEKAMEVGGDILKIQPYSVSEIKEFCGAFQDGGLYQWRELLKILELDHQSDENIRHFEDSVMFTPLHSPPSFNEVLNWDKTRQRIVELHKNEEKDEDDDNGGDDFKTKSPTFLENSMNNKQCKASNLQITSGGSMEKNSTNRGRPSTSKADQIKKKLSQSNKSTSKSHSGTYSPEPNTSFSASTPLSHLAMTKDKSPFLHAFSSQLMKDSSDEKNVIYDDLEPKQRCMKKRKIAISQSDQPIKRRVSFSQDNNNDRNMASADLTMIPMQENENYIPGDHNRRAKFASLYLTDKEMLNPVLELQTNVQIEANTHVTKLQNVNDLSKYSFF